MRVSSQRESLAVYDFDADEEAVEAAAEKYSSRFQPHRRKLSAASAAGAPGGGGGDALDDYSFLQAFHSGSQMRQSEVTGVLCVDLHERSNVQQSHEGESPEANTPSDKRTDFDGVVATSSYNGHNCAYPDQFEPTNMMAKGQSAMEVSVLTPAAGSEQFFDIRSHGIVADSEEGSWSSSPESSSTTNDMPGYTEHQMPYGCYTTFEETIENDGPVVLHPEFVTSNTTLYLEPQLTFSSDCFKIESFDSDICDDDEKIAVEWGISEIVQIDCQWTDSVASAVMRVLVRANAETEHSNPVKVQFTLTDVHWPKKEQKIWNLASRYRDIWNTVPLDDLVLEDCRVEPTLFFPKEYFTENLGPFEDVIYPNGDPDAVSISKRDVELLLPETFVNDTIIDFYIKYLSNRIHPNEKQRYHFFNSFFFRKLADLDKDPGKAPDGRAAFQRVRKWTRKVDLFEKDFIFIPVNFNLHWSLVVICHPGEVATFEDDNIKGSPKAPCILHMDSLKGSHDGLKNIIQSYLWEEWKERHPESTTDNSAKFLNLRFVSLELPQQDNSFDCGLFLLHYVELFLDDAPSSFNPLKINEFSSFLGADWFPPAEASFKRSVIRKLIYDLLNDPSQKVPPATSSKKHHSGECHKSDDVVHEPGLELLAQQCSPASGHILEAGKVSMASLENPDHSDLHELEEHADKAKIVCVSSQDGEDNQPTCANSDEQLCPQSCTQNDAGTLDTLGCVVEEKNNNEDSSLEFLDNSHKAARQADETGTLGVVNENHFLVSENSTLSGEKVIACKDGSPGNNTCQVADEKFEASPEIHSVGVEDACKDDVVEAMTVDENHDNECCPISTEIKDGNTDDCLEIGGAKADNGDTVDGPDIGNNVVEHRDSECCPISTEIKDGNTDVCMEVGSTKAHNGAVADGTGVGNAVVEHHDNEGCPTPEIKDGNMDDHLEGGSTNSDDGTAADGPDVGDTVAEHHNSEVCPTPTEIKDGNTDDCTEVGSAKADNRAATDGPDVGNTVAEHHGSEGWLVPTEIKDGNTDDRTVVDSRKADNGASMAGPDDANAVIDSGVVACQRSTCSDAKRPLTESTCHGKDIVISDGESPMDKDDARRTETRTHKHHYKRRKVVVPEGERRRTRSSMREGHHL